MTPVELDYRRVEARVPVDEFGDRVQAFLMHGRDSRVNGPTAAEVIEELPIDADLRQDAIVALETLGRLRDIFAADVSERGEATPEQQRREARRQPGLDPRHGAGRRGTTRRRSVSDDYIRRMAEADLPGADDLDGESFDAYLHRMANMEGDASDEDVAASAHAELPEYDDGPAASPEEAFRKEVRILCEGVCSGCGERARRLIEAGVTTEKLIGEMTAFIRQKAERLKPAGGALQQ